MSRPLTLNNHEPSCARRWLAVSGHQSGYTVIELMIVLAVIAMLALLSVPQLTQPLAKSRVKEAVQQVTKLIAETRVQAMKSGEVHQLQFELSGDRLRWGPAAAMAVADRDSGNFEGPDFEILEQPTSEVVPSIPREPSLPEDVYPRQSTVDELLTASDTTGNMAVTETDRLARGLSFQDPSIQHRPLAELNTGKGLNDMPSLQLDQDDTSQLDAIESVHEHLAPVRWSNPINFYPSGLTSQTTLVMLSDNGFSVNLQLRRLTGGITIGPIQRRMVK